jgi:hypothetical protein
MKGTFRFLLLITIICVLWLVSAMPTSANGEVWVRLSADAVDVTVGEEFTLDVLVENAPEIYGVDVQLKYDQTILEVVDMDAEQDGIQIIPGSFLDPEQSFPLQNEADNQTGVIDFAATLLSPAPAVQGDGILCQVRFRAIADGHAVLSLSESTFGTQTGETITPQLGKSETTVLSGDTDLTGDEGQESTSGPSVEGTGETPGHKDWFLPAVVGLATVGVISVILFVIWFNRRRQGE